MRYSGENWEYEAPMLPAIDVIEPAHRKTKKVKKSKKVKTVPFGFARALPKQTKKGKKR